MSSDLDRVAALVASADRVLFVTGAGMSADSGLPTYRGIGGLYEVETTEEGFAIEEALSGEMMRSRPEICWKYIAQIERACRGARHHAGHAVIARLQDDKDVWVLTQNVDGFHADAGTRELIEIHGNVRRLLCTRCPHARTVSSFEGLRLPPRCPDCEALVRPDVVLFGELLPEAPLARLRRQLAVGFDLVVVIGTTAVFPYIAAPVLTARAAGVPTVEINPGLSTVSELVDLRLPLGARDALTQIEARL